MSFDVNEVTVLGRLGQDPEVRSFSNGGSIANLRIATSEKWKDRNTGEQQERTEWHSVTVRTPYLITFCENFLRKGSRVYARGKLQTRKWQDRDGNDRYTTEIVVAGYDGNLIGLSDMRSRNEGSGQRGSGDWNQSGAGASREQQMGGGHQSGTGGGGSTYDDLDDDIPF